MISCAGNICCSELNTGSQDQEYMEQQSHPYWILWLCLHEIQIFTSASLSKRRAPLCGAAVDQSMALPRGALTPMHNPAAASSGGATHGVRPLIRSGRACGTGRRGLLSLLLMSTTTIPKASESKKALLQEFLTRSKENKAKNDKERLDDYYKRNYKDYFELIQGSVEGKKEEELSETEKGILEWLRKNRK